jgi:hypothetical protein
MRIHKGQWCEPLIFQIIASLCSPAFRSQAAFAPVFFWIVLIFLVLFPHTIPAWTVSGGQSRFLVGKEYAVFFIAAGKSFDCRQGSAAVKPTIDFLFAVPAESAWHFRKIWFSICSK